MLSTNRSVSVLDEQKENEKKKKMRYTYVLATGTLIHTIL